MTTIPSELEDLIMFLKQQMNMTIIFEETVLKNLSNEPEDLVLAEERTTEADRELIMDGEIVIDRDDSNEISNR